MGWENKLAGHFIDRDNKEYVGTVIGEIVSLKPFKVSILNGVVVLDSSILYVTKTIKEMIKEYDDIWKKKSKIEIKPYKVNATFNGSSGSLEVTEEKKDYEATIKFDNTLKVGDKVLVTSNESNQFYYVVDKLESID